MTRSTRTNDDDDTFEDGNESADNGSEYEQEGASSTSSSDFEDDEDIPLNAHCSSSIKNKEAESSETESSEPVVKKSTRGKKKAPPPKKNNRARGKKPTGRGRKKKKIESDDETSEASSSGGRKNSAQVLTTEVFPFDEEHAVGIDKLLGHRKVTGKDGKTVDEFFVKWKGKAYIHCEWLPEAEINVDQHGRARVQRFLKKHGDVTIDEEMFPDEFVEVDRIVWSRDVILEDESVVPEYLVKWKGLQYSDSTWEFREDIDDEDKITAYETRQKRPPVEFLKPAPRPPPSSWTTPYEETPSFFPEENQLRDYQLEGMNWLISCWFREQGSILADEMGLGKTVQSTSLLEYVRSEHGNRGPFLVVGPLSTLGHWVREIEAWTTQNVIVYHGSAKSRAIIRDYEFYYYEENGKPFPEAWKFNTLVTTYETIISDMSVLNKIPWQIIVVDEAHRLKNYSSKLAESLRTYPSEHRVLLTGTPVQNNASELWALLHFLEPEKFAHESDFLEDFGDVTESKQVTKLQETLRPYLLRRLKEDVEKSLKRKEETIIEVEMTPIQKKYYRAIYDRNFTYLAKGAKGQNISNLKNVVMELRKCCNHPFLLNNVEQIELDAKDQPDDPYRLLIDSSGKMVLLDKLLPKLKEQGHRVLIFSQMVRVLDILEDYLHYRQWTYERIDGRVRGTDRQAAIDRYSRPDSDRFVFLLCTKAGGLGINLTAADTCVIFDSDWNPQNDIQAQARCHRIGQRKEVKIYRLVTSNSYEQEMFERASKKLGLDQAILHNITTEKQADKTQMTNKDIDRLLKHGAYGVYIQDDDEEANKFCEEDIDSILQRRTKTIAEVGMEGGAFSKANFISNAAQENKIDVHDPEFWEKINPDAFMQQEDDLLYQPRVRRQTQRYGIDAFEDDEDDETYKPPKDDDDEEEVAGKRGVGAPPGNRRKRWTKKERHAVTRALQALGYGQWEAIREMSGLSKRTLADLEAYANAYINLCGGYTEFKEKNEARILQIVQGKSPNPFPSELAEEAIAREKAQADEMASEENPDAAKNPEGKEPEDSGPPADSEDSAPVDGKAAEGETGEKAPGKDNDMSGSQEGRSSAVGRSDAGDDEGGAAGASRVDESMVSAWPTVEEREASIRESFNEEDYLQSIQRNAYLTLGRLESLLFLRLHVQAHDESGTPIEVPHLESMPPAPWWSEEEDRDLLRGILKHGYSNYKPIREDPDLCFSKRKYVLEQAKKPEGGAEPSKEGEEKPVDGEDAPKGTGEGVKPSAEAADEDLPDADGKVKTEPAATCADEEMADGPAVKTETSEEKPLVPSEATVKKEAPDDGDAEAGPSASAGKSGADGTERAVKVEGDGAKSEAGATANVSGKDTADKAGSSEKAEDAGGKDDDSMCLKDEDGNDVYLWPMPKPITVRAKRLMDQLTRILKARERGEELDRLRRDREEKKKKKEEDKQKRLAEREKKMSERMKEKQDRLVKLREERQRKEEEMQRMKEVKVKEKQRREAELARTWNKRERCEFNRLLFMYGEPPPANAGNGPNWEIFTNQRKGGLKKPPEVVGRYFDEYMEQCYRSLSTARGQTFDEALLDREFGRPVDYCATPVCPELAEETVSSKTAQRVIERLKLMRDVRLAVKHPDMEHLIKNVTGVYADKMPDWWQPTYDKPLLHAVAKHGFGNWVAIQADPRLPFNMPEMEIPKERPLASRLRLLVNCVLKPSKGTKRTRDKAKTQGLNKRASFPLASTVFDRPLTPIKINLDALVEKRMKKRGLSVDADGGDRKRQKVSENGSSRKANGATPSTPSASSAATGPQVPVPVVEASGTPPDVRAKDADVSASKPCLASPHPPAAASGPPRSPLRPPQPQSPRSPMAASTSPSLHYAKTMSSPGAPESSGAAASGTGLDSSPHVGASVSAKAAGLPPAHAAGCPTSSPRSMPSPTQPRAPAMSLPTATAVNSANFAPHHKGQAASATGTATTGLVAQPIPHASVASPTAIRYVGTSPHAHTQSLPVHPASPVASYLPPNTLAANPPRPVAQHGLNSPTDLPYSQHHMPVQQPRQAAAVQQQGQQGQHAQNLNSHQQVSGSFRPPPYS
eukprot:Rmarinus@m.22515